MIIFLFWILGGLLVAQWYKNWDQGYGKGLFISILFSPVIAAIVLLLSGRKARTCPKCAEKIRMQALVCKHCGNENFEPGPKEKLKDSMENIIG